MGIGLAIIAGVGALLFIVIFLAYAIGTYNSLIRLRNNIDKSWSNIDVLLKQRADELPNIIASVKGYMAHERELFESITSARAAMMNAKTMEDKANADYMISGALKTLFAVAEIIRRSRRMRISCSSSRELPDLKMRSLTGESSTMIRSIHII